MNLSPAQVRPGQEVTLWGFSYKGDLPALVTVTGVGGAPLLGAAAVATELGRSVGLVRSGPSTNVVALVLLGLGAAIVATLVAWVAATGPARRRPAPEVARVAR